MASLLQEICFGPSVMVAAHIRLSERDARLNRKLLRATLMQPGLAELTISEMLPQDLDADLVGSGLCWSYFHSHLACRCHVAARQKVPHGGARFMRFLWDCSYSRYAVVCGVCADT